MAIEPEEEGHSLFEDEGGPVKSFLDHLEDFRWALIKSCAAIAIAVLLCLLAGNHVVSILMRPLAKAPQTYPGTNQVVVLNFGTNRLGTYYLDSEQEKTWKLSTNRLAVMELAPVTIPAGSNSVQVMALQETTNAETLERAQHMQLSLVVLGPSQAFLVGFRVAIYAGIAIASPFVFFFMGQFILPALRVREKRYLYRGLAFAVPLFLCGVSFCYFILMPAALAASQIYSNWFGWESTMWQAGEYLEFVCKFMLGMGLGFEMPVVILVLVKLGLISYRFLVKMRPYMIVINLVLGAVLTTPEVFTQILMAIPLQILFEISIFVAWRWDRAEQIKAGTLPPRSKWWWVKWLVWLLVIAGIALLCAYPLRPYLVKLYQYLQH